VFAVFLAMGAWRMARHRALVRRAPAIEALGSVTVLCTDKTGTLTENRMAVAELVAGSQHAAPSGPLAPAVRELLRVADRACPEHPTDPMERAIRSAAASPATSERRVHDYPLRPDLLATTHVWAEPLTQAGSVACKGAPEAIVSLCALPAEEAARVLAQVRAMATRGLRVLAVASARWSGPPASLPMSPRGFDFEWRGLVGLADPLRAGVPAAVSQAQQAGVRVLMLTGDHPDTARAIATQAGLRRPEVVMTGDELGRLDDAGWARAAAEVDVFARVRPEDKLRLVRALKAAGAVVAMTGDGVNDAPALVAAHVGVAMGARGTDVAREAASIVLLDDDFVTVVQAIRHGRTIYDNLVRAMRYILAVHVPITGLALLPLLLGAPLILLPVHVVFLELIIDPASSLVFEREPASADVMQRGPRAPQQRLFDAATFFGSLAQGLVAFVAVVAIYLGAAGLGLAERQTAALAFVALIAGNLGLVALNRTPGTRRWLPGNNPAFLIVASGALSVLVLATQVQPVALLFRFVPPPWPWWSVALALPLLLLLLVDAGRGVFRRRGAAAVARAGLVPHRRADTAQPARPAPRRG
jgi:P-type Ca2+ transporter type 2C